MAGIRRKQRSVHGAGGRAHWTVLLLVVTAIPVLAIALSRNSTDNDGGAPADPGGQSGDQLGALLAVPCGQTARTDRGGTILVYAVCAPSLPDSALQEAEENMAAKFPVALVTGPPSLAYNCHGWIFAGGRYWIDQRDVDEILRDNGYQRVATPTAGDVVIYRLPDGTITHSGLVCSASGNRVEVESKWGYVHRVRHGVANHPFTGSWTYYHVERDSHLIRFEDWETHGEPKYNE